MAGMFYSSKEAAERLNISEDQLQQLVKEGKLREFRDGANRLFKIDEVEALAPQIAQPPQAEPAASEQLEQIEVPKPAPEPSPEPAEAPQPAAEPEPQPVEPSEAEVPQLDSSVFEIPELEQVEPTAEEQPAEEELLETPELETPKAEQPEQPTPEAEIPLEPEAETAELELVSEQTAEQPAEPAAAPQADTEEISLAPESSITTPPSELTDADTAIVSEGINVLGETDKDYEITDDTLGETASTLGMTGTTPEASLEEIESDVNLDSFGSGSGLLDLSLQADDTSLGGILDEIYTAEGEGAEPTPEGTSEDVAAEAEQALPEEEIAAPVPAPEMAVVAAARFEPAPDVQSTTLGMLLILPFVMILYTAIATVAGMRGIVPSVLATIQGFIWYIVIGALVVALGVVAAAFMLGRDTSGVKKQKKPKAKKAKKGKKAAEPASDSQ